MLNRLLIRMPRRLPVGMTEFNEFTARIISLTGPFADLDSMTFALASILIHADAKFGALPDKFFVDRLIKSAANQVASAAFQDIKAKQAAAIEAAKAEELAKQQAAAPAQPEAADVKVLPNQTV